MKSFKFIILTLLFGVFTGCSDNTDFDELPQPIVSFITQYWPDPNVVSFTKTDKTYTVIIKNGPSLIFDSSYQWTSVNGNGLPLPEVFLFDNLPDDLYSYLSATEATDEVFSAQRDARKYTLKLLNVDVSYDIATHKVTVSDADILYIS